ncbi:MAG: EscU/YscU/HrcU family type III secretion system export apparatus switch protein [Planctomycetaceae bacterium]|nr:EscU/YscU/HrcU family type III secretion system export apparatus switch protein [Planctomycetaceae bacterium]
MSEEKTFEPTPRHREMMRRQGETALSRDLVNASMLLAGMLLFWGFGHFLVSVPLQFAENTWSDEPWLRMTPELFMEKWNDWVLLAIFYVVPLLALVPIVTALVSLVQTQFLFLPSRIAPKWKNVDPANGMKRIFSWDPVMAAGFGIAKLFLVGAFIVWMVTRQIPIIGALCQMEFQTAVLKMQNIILGTGMRIALVLFLLAAADYGWQFYRYRLRLRMTYEQMKEEIRITEGDQTVKQQRRRRD